MQTILNKYLPLFKLKICALITVSALVGLYLTSEGRISFATAILLVLATLLASGSASAFNHYFDTDIDRVMDRTKNRPLPCGLISDSRQVLWIAIILFVPGVIIAAWLLNYMVALHLTLGAFIYGIVYTAWLKRRTWANIIIGGLAGSFAVLAGGASAKPELCLPPALLAIMLFFWTPSHFWSFAIAYKEEYKKARIPMLPVVIGGRKTAMYIILNSIFLIAASLLPFYYGYLGKIYTAAAILAGGYFLVMNIRLLKDNSREIAWRNFKASIHYLWIIFIAVVIDVAINSPAHASFQEGAIKSYYDVRGNKLPDYTLIDQDGNIFNTRDLKGKPVVLSLIYIGCGHACSAITSRLHNALEVAGNDLGTKFRAVTLSFDPENDTPEKLKAFGENFSDDFRKWRFATSDKKTIERLTRDIGFYYTKNETGFDHMNMVAIIDRDGRIYQQVYGLDFRPDDILNPVYQAMNLIKAPQSKQLSVIDRLKLFCYKYDESSGQYKPDYGLIITLSTGSFLQAATMISIIYHVWGKGRNTKAVRMAMKS